MDSGKYSMELAFTIAAMYIIYLLIKYFLNIRLKTKLMQSNIDVDKMKLLLEETKSKSHNVVLFWFLILFPISLVMIFITDEVWDSPFRFPGSLLLSISISLLAYFWYLKKKVD